MHHTPHVFLPRSNLCLQCRFAATWVFPCYHAIASNYGKTWSHDLAACRKATLKEIQSCHCCALACLFEHAHWQSNYEATAKSLVLEEPKHRWNWMHQPILFPRGGKQGSSTQQWHWQSDTPPGCLIKKRGWLKAESIFHWRRWDRQIRRQPNHFIFIFIFVFVFIGLPCWLETNANAGFPNLWGCDVMRCDDGKNRQSDTTRHDTTRFGIWK